MIDEKGLQVAVDEFRTKHASNGGNLHASIRAAITAYLSAGAEPVAWEFFQDEGYFGMWCVRQAGASRFGDGFHVVSQKEARALHVLLSTTPTPEASDE